MIDEWYYLAFGEEHGPVSFARLKEMAVKKQLAPQDRVRSAEWKEGVPARTVPQLFPHLPSEAEPAAVEDIDDLDFQSIQVADRETERELMNLEDLGIRIADAPSVRPAYRVDAYGSRLDDEQDSAEAQPASLDDLDVEISDEPARQQTTGPVDAYGSPVRDDSPEADERWICQMLGQQLGPMPLADLQEMARKGEISLDDQVRRADESEWRPARTVEGLFPGFEYRTDSGSSEKTSTADAAPLSEMRKAEEKLSEVLAELSNTETPIGPEWNEEEASAPSRKPAPRPQPKKSASKSKQARSKVTSPPVESKSDSSHKGLSKGETSPAEDPVPADLEPVVSSANPPDPAHSPAEQMATMMPAQPTAPIKPAAPAKPKVKGPSLGERFANLFEHIKGNPKALGVVAVLALVLIIKYAPLSFGTSDQDYLDQITEIGNTYKEMRTRQASGAEYHAFQKDAIPQVEALHSALKKAGAGSQDRPKQEMLWACMKLDEMLQMPLAQDETETEETYDKHITNARALIQGLSVEPAVPETEPQDSTSTE